MWRAAVGPSSCYLLALQSSRVGCCNMDHNPPQQGGLCVELQWEQRPGETIYKGHRSYDLMLNLQLGIRWSVGKITPELVGATLPEETFMQKVTAAGQHCWNGPSFELDGVQFANLEAPVPCYRSGSSPHKQHVHASAVSSCGVPCLEEWFLCVECASSGSVPAGLMAVAASLLGKCALIRYTRCPISAGHCCY